MYLSRSMSPITNILNLCIYWFYSHGSNHLQIETIWGGKKLHIIWHSGISCCVQYQNLYWSARFKFWLFHFPSQALLNCFGRQLMIVRCLSPWCVGIQGRVLSWLQSCPCPFIETIPGHCADKPTENIMGYYSKEEQLCNSVLVTTLCIHWNHIARGPLWIASFYTFQKYPLPALPLG